MLQALVFDFDGLILETEEPVLRSWQEIYREYGLELPVNEWLACVGTDYSEETFHPYEYLERHIGPLDRAAVHERQHRRYVKMVEAQPVLPGVERLIMEARERGLRLAVASSSSREWVVGNLERLGLAAHFAAIRCADDVAQVKPDPALYRMAVEALGVPPAAAAALEDSPPGITAARRAGLYCVAVPNALTRRLDLSHADLMVSSLADLSLDDLITAMAGR